MSQNSYPKVETPFTDDQWKNLFLTLGRGIIDKGGFPYKLTARDSVTNTVTIGVDSRDGRNFAVLDGFLHTMDAPEQVSVPAVTTDTTYEIGLVYDPTQHNAPGGPITLTAWTTPADNTGGKSRLVLYRMTRKANLALGSTSYTEERPRACPVFSVSTASQLPKNSLVLVDSIGVSRTSGNLYRADISESGEISWTQIGGSSSSSQDVDTINAVQTVHEATWEPTGLTLMWRGHDGSSRVKANLGHPDNILNRSAGDDRYARTSHKHDGSDITSRVPFEHVDGSTAAYSNTSLGSTWTTVAVNSSGFLGRYPSALKYKKNIRAWKIDPLVALGVEPIKYEDKESGDTRIGVLADSYVSSIPELVHTDPTTGEVEGWNYMLWGTLQQVALRHLHEQNQAQQAEIELLRDNQAEILAILGLNTDSNGRVVTNTEGA